MKKVITFFLSLMLLMSIVPVVLADNTNASVDTYAVEVKTSQSAVNQGEVVDVSVYLNAVPVLQSAGFHLELNDKYFQYVDGSGKCTVQGFPDNEVKIKTFGSDGQGRINGVFTLDKAAKFAGGEIFTFQIKVKQDAALETMFKINGTAAVRDGEQNLNVSVKPAEMKITSRIPGDANGDGKVDINDANLMLQKTAKWDVGINMIASDVTADGKVDINDANLMLQKIAKWDVKLK